MQPSGLSIDAAKSAATPDRCEVKDLKVSDAEIDFTRTDANLPVTYDADAGQSFPYMAFSAELNRYPLTVTDLKAGNWQLTVGDATVGTFTAEELAAGVDLAPKNGPWQALGRTVNQLSAQQETLYFNRWRNVQMSVPADAQADAQPLLAKMDQITAAKEQERVHACDNRTWAWKLTRQP